MKNIFLLAVTIVIAMGEFGYPSERETDDASVDLVEALVATRRLEEAQWVCRYMLGQSPEQALEHAKWSCRLAEVLAEGEATGLFGGNPSELPSQLQPAIDRACESLDRLRASYPDAPSDLFVRSTRMAVRTRVLRAAIVASSVMPANEALLDKLLSMISRLQIETEALQRDVNDRWSSLVAVSSSSGRATVPQIASEEFQRLQQEILVDRISIALLQTELFLPNTQDYRAAATSAATFATEAIGLLPDDCDAKLSARLLLAESLLRSGDLSAAGEVIQHERSNPKVAAMPSWLALQARLSLASGDTKTAREICERYFANNHLSNGASAGGQASGNLEMEFAMLNVLLSGAQSDADVSSWLERMERLHGLFARRRAEAIALRRMRRADDASDPSAIHSTSPSLIAAQGEDWLRRNDPRQAAGLLRQAALVERTAKQAFQYAAKSAAASIAANDLFAAIDVLRTVSLKHGSAPQAVGLMMQAALLASQPSNPVDHPDRRIATLKELLAEIAQSWPRSKEAIQANQWLCRIFHESGQHREAANAALELLMLGQRPDQVPHVTAQWFELVSRLPPDEVTTELDSLAASLQEVVWENESLHPSVQRSAVLLLDRSEMDALARKTNVSLNENFVAQLQHFRSTSTGQVETGQVETKLLSRGHWRLHRDAMLDSRLQPAVGALLLNWPGKTAWESAVAEFWNQPSESAIAQLTQLSLSGQEKLESLRRGMQVLAASPSMAAKAAAIELADRAASLVPQKSPIWYQTKLNAIKWLSEANQTDEAGKRAQYILLLQPPTDDAMRQQFRRYVEKTNTAAN